MKMLGKSGDKNTERNVHEQVMNKNWPQIFLLVRFVYVSGVYAQGEILALCARH